MHPLMRAMSNRGRLITRPMMLTVLADCSTPESNDEKYCCCKELEIPLEMAVARYAPKNPMNHQAGDIVAMR